VVDPGKDAMISLTLIGADDNQLKLVERSSDHWTFHYNGLIGANGVVSFNVKGEAFTGTTVVGVVKVEGYNSATFTIAVTEKPEVKTVIELVPGMDIYTVNGETKFWDATPYIKEGRTMVPIRHLAEALGFQASWTSPILPTRWYSSTQLNRIQRRTKSIHSYCSSLVTPLPW